jgi:hypothetical protein
MVMAVTTSRSAGGAWCFGYCEHIVREPLQCRPVDQIDSRRTGGPMRAGHCKKPMTGVDFYRGTMFLSGGHSFDRALGAPRMRIDAKAVEKRSAVLDGGIGE